MTPIVSTFAAVMHERGLVQDATTPDLAALFARPRTVYVGFDPTAPSLHVGHLTGALALRRAQACGHTPIAVVGGATALIGDPSGKIELRPVLTKDETAHNARAIEAQLARLLRFGDGPGDAKLVNNLDWLAPWSYLDFLRDVGRHFSVNRMLQMDSVKLRLEKGLNFVEFNYMLLQAYDFQRLYELHGCDVQMGGSDQFGNIVMGVELVRRVHGAEAAGFTWPLLTTADGKKMGKTEAGAVWLDPARTSPFAFYQYWRNTADADVRRMLLLFTDLAPAEIAALTGADGAGLNHAKERLAHEVTALVHGAEAAHEAQRAARAAFAGGPSAELPADAELPSVSFDRARLDGEGVPLTVLLAETKLVQSRSEVRRLVDEGGITVAGVVATSAAAPVTTAAVDAHGRIIVRLGKKRVFAIRPA